MYIFCTLGLWRNILSSISTVLFGPPSTIGVCSNLVVHMCSFLKGLGQRVQFLCGNIVVAFDWRQSMRWHLILCWSKVIVVGSTPVHILVANAITKRPQSLAPLCHCTSAYIAYFNTLLLCNQLFLQGIERPMQFVYTHDLYKFP